MRKILSFLTVLLVLLTMAMPAFAAESTITWQGQEKGFGFAPGSEYTTTDLFDGFKNVMPGDKLKETITLKNTATDSDYIRLYLRAVAHDGSTNSPVVASDETSASMADFLSQLTMRVYNGTSLIYEASPDKTAGLTENVFLAQLDCDESITLIVELDVPSSLSDAYANRLGEVDWVFTAEAFESTSTSGSLIQTGQLNWPIPVLAGIGLVLLLLGLFLIFGKRKHDRD